MGSLTVSISPNGGKVASIFKNKKVVLTLVAVVVVSFIAIVRPTGSQEQMQRPQGSGPRLGEVKIPVRGLVVTQVPLENKIGVTGSVLANEEVELRSEVSGKVVKILFKEGSHVKQGNLLVKINDADLQAQLQKAESSKKLLEEKEARQRKLREINAISQEQYDESLNELNGLKSEVDLLNAQIQKTEIRAPFDGVVGIRFISEGSYISPATLVARMEDISLVKIDFSVPEKYSNIVQKGNKIRFTVEGSSRQYEGTIYAMEPRIDPVTRTLRLRAIARNERESLVPGSFAKVDLVLNRQEAAVMIPTFAVIPDAEGQKVYVARNGRAALVSVETGLRTEEQIHVLKGLQPNDTLLTTGLLQLRPGVAVNITVDK